MNVGWCAAAAAAALACPSLAFAQDDGPRVYQLAPNGAQTLTAFAVAKRGAEGPEPGQTFPGTQTASDILVLRWAGTFDAGGRAFTPFVIIPTGRVRVTSDGRQESSGFGDAQLGATLGLLGAPALSVERFADFRPQATASLLARVFLPTGAYDPQAPVNFGSNRLAMQLGLPAALVLGQSYRDRRLTSLEVLPTVTFYGANGAPFSGDVRTQEPLFSVEAHLTHNFDRRIWMSADVLYRYGGESSTDGAPNHDGSSGWSAGLSLALPLPARSSVILTYVHVVDRWDAGPDGWFTRAALVVAF